MTLAVVATGPKDIRDAEWLAEQVADLGRGIEAARLIWANWFDGRQVGRLHPGQTPGDYIASLGMRLTLPEALAAMPDASSRQVAAVAGVDHVTVLTARRNGENSPVSIRDPRTGNDRPARVVREVKAEVIELEEASIDDRLWERLGSAMEAIEALVESDATSVAATVPVRRRAATAKRLRKLGTYLGRVAWTLEGDGAQTQ